MERPHHDERAALRARRPGLELRARVLRGLREALIARGYLEVETPVRLSAPALERHIDAEPSGDRYLRTSPELHMKRLLAAGYGRLFQIGPCFRRGERGPRHHPEYTMLEWYAAGADVDALLREMEEWLPAAARAAGGRAAGLFEPPWARRTVSEAFRRWAGWDPVEQYDADRFDLDLTGLVEPALPRDRAVILLDYPAAAAALSRLRPGNPRVAERAELYAAGVELANAYGELTDPAEQRARFEACARERAAAGKPVYPLDEDFLRALESGLPPCAGAALGVDRLTMVLAGAEDLSDVTAFRE
jgi:lysyl-tRNA synthetase class 2